MSTLRGISEREALDTVTSRLCFTDDGRPMGPVRDLDAAIRALCKFFVADPHVVLAEFVVGHE